MTKLLDIAHVDKKLERAVNDESPHVVYGLSFKSNEIDYVGITLLRHDDVRRTLRVHVSHEWHASRSKKGEKFNRHTKVADGYRKAESLKDIAVRSWTQVANKEEALKLRAAMIKKHDPEYNHPGYIKPAE